jgi:hypothetical protein
VSPLRGSELFSFDTQRFALGYKALRRSAAEKWQGCNPVTRGLVENPEDWKWSSYRSNALDDEGPVKINVDWTKIRVPVRTS